MFNCSPFSKLYSNFLIKFFSPIQDNCVEKSPELQKLKANWDACSARVHSRKETAETCSEEAIDFMNAVNGCVAPALLQHLGGPGKIYS